MNTNKFIYRLYGRSKGRNKKKINYNNFTSIINRFAVNDLKKTNHNILDIGSGYGESTINLAENFSNSKIIACENFFDGNFRLISEIERKGLKNIYIHKGNVHEFLDKLNQNSYFNSVWILFPDPWPKKKHFKRRLMNILFFRKLSKFLKKNAYINIATDSKSYLREILYLAFKLKNDFCWENQKIQYWEYKNTGLVETKYYKKAIKNGSNPFFIKLRKL